MKKLIIYTILLVGLSVFSCSRVNEEEKTLENQVSLLPQDLTGLKIFGIELPKGTTLFDSNKSLIRFRLPKNYIYGGVTKTGEYFYSRIGSYTCTSVCTDGCDVVAIGEDIGCSACSDNNQCVGKRNEETLEKGFGEGIRGGIIDLSKGIKFIEKQDHEIVNSVDLDILMNNPTVKDELNRFLLKYSSLSESQKNKKLVLVDFYGQKISLFVDSSMNMAGKIGGEPTCNCDQGEGCALEEIKGVFGPLGYKCISGNCIACTMHLK